ncbi:MAG: type II secretion system secretin GspD [Desulfoarculaceae bacterium]|nr:type II secretion system secretin GspD [Desulfoarculaceae bacterium]
MFIIKRFALLCLVTVLLLPSSACAEEQIAFNFNNADIRTVIKSVAHITGRNFVIDPAVKGEVTIISSETMSAEELYAIFLSVLQVHGYTAIESGNIIKVIPVVKAKQETDATAMSRRGSSPSDQTITRIYKLRYIGVQELISVLKPLVANTAYLGFHLESNTLIMVDRAANIERQVKIIESIDHDTTGKSEIITLQYASATDLVAVIASLENKANKRAGDHLQMAADARTNSILLSGDPHYILRVKAQIAHLDTPVISEGSTQVVFLRNAKAIDLVPILTGTVKAETPAGQAAPPPAKQEAIIVLADEASNALIITAPPAQMKSIQSVVRQLDIRRAQLMIEAIIAEVSVDNAEEFGIQWRSGSDVGAGNNAVLGGTNFNATGSGINAISVNPEALIHAEGLSLGFFSGTSHILGQEIINLSSLIRALSYTGNTNILSTPSLMTMDNVEAEIVVGQNVPFPTGSYTSTGSTTSTVNPFTTYERHDVGIKLKVKPQITEGDTIRLDITQEVSSVVPASFGQAAGPTTNTRTITTSVLVDDGKLLVLGGLISNDVREEEHSVPILGRIPLLGALFRYNSVNHDKRNLMVFLRPVIIREAASSSRITFDKYDYMRDLQQRHGEQQSFLLPKDEAPLLPVAGQGD